MPRAPPEAALRIGAACVALQPPAEKGVTKRSIQINRKTGTGNIAITGQINGIEDMTFALYLLYQKQTSCRASDSPRSPADSSAPFHLRIRRFPLSNTRLSSGRSHFPSSATEVLLGGESFGRIIHRPIFRRKRTNYAGRATARDSLQRLLSRLLFSFGGNRSFVYLWRHTRAWIRKDAVSPYDGPSLIYRPLPLGAGGGARLQLRAQRRRRCRSSP